VRFALAVVVSTGCAQLIHIPGYESSDDGGPSNAPDALQMYANAVLADSPVAYFHLDEMSGAAAIDAAADGSNGTYLGNITLGQPGAFLDSGTSVGFAGSDAGLLLGDRFAFSGRAKFSLEAWIQPTSFDGNFHEIGSRWRQPTGREGYTWYQANGNFGFERDASDAETSNIGVDNMLHLNAWSHVVATYDGTTMVIYVDGLEQGSTTSTLSLPVVDLAAMIGAANGSPLATPFNGNIDEYAVYDHALAPDRVAAHYEAAQN
jgi:Concanavalin A-like lectin/glucanases superfamily